MNNKSNNNKYILLTKRLPEDRNASLKAPEDIEKIFSTEFGKTYRLYKSEKYLIKNIQCVITFIYLKCRAFFNRKKEILIVQVPLYPRRPFNEFFPHMVGYKKKIAIIHDLDSIRFSPDDNNTKLNEIATLSNYDAIVCHNKTMGNWLLNNGIKIPVISLDIFDYLCDKINENKINMPIDKYSIVFAGNLQKSVFLKDISASIKRSLYLYGNKPNFKIGENIYYEGSYNADELPLVLRGEFGLIWDGDSINTCSGLNGNYMQYNNPHKLSLYIASGIPVIIWSKAAISEYIKKKDIGICVERLSDIDSILDKLPELRYKELLKNVKNVQKDIISGSMIKKALNQAINEINCC